MAGVRSLAFEVRRFVDDAARSLGMHRSDLEAVGLLIDARRHGERLTPGQLSRHAGLSAAAVSALVDRLERSGHVTRTRHERDGRKVFLDVTESADAMSRESFSALNRRMYDVLARYPDDELEIAARVMHDLADAARASAHIRTGERPLAP